MTNGFEQFPPDLLENELLCRKQKLEELIALKKKELQHAPEGRLRLSRKKCSIQYYLISEKQKERVNGKYIAKSKMDYIKALAQKEYNLKILPLLQEQLNAVNQALKKIDENNLSKIYESFSEQRKCLLEPVTLPVEKYIDQWQKTEYQRKCFSFDTPELFTSKGERVRSKSEIIIADTLNRLGIPYRYEFPLQLGKIVVHPDFYCLNTRTRKEYVWEHFGMMDNLEYAGSAAKKIKTYQEGGYFPGDNFIFSMETSDSPINTKQIKEIIEKYLK